LASAGLAAAAGAHLAGHHAHLAPLTAPHGQNHAASWPGSSIQGGLGHGLIRLALPFNYRDYGVITIWNNTTGPVNFLVSASTFNNGAFYPFLLQSGQHQSYYAAQMNGVNPVFQVRLAATASPIVIPNENIVFETTTYVPAGTAGWPYAINLGVNGYYLSYI
jgi:hypothetical protein